MVKLNDDLILQFCDPEKGNRYALHLPWVVDGKLYATNGRVALECDPSCYTGELGTGNHPKICDVFAPLDEITTWRDDFFPDWPQCDKCYGQGRVFDEEGDEQRCEDCLLEINGLWLQRANMKPILCLWPFAWVVVNAPTGITPGLIGFKGDGWRAASSTWEEREARKKANEQTS